MIVEAIQSMFSSLTFNGTHPRDPAIAKMLGMGMQTKAKVHVDHDRVMAIPAVKRAVQIITDKLFGMPWYVYQVQPDGREYEKTHPSWRCVTGRANADINDAALRQQLTQWAMLYGNGCAAIVRPEGWPESGNVELIPLLPDRTKPIRASRDSAIAVGEPALAGTLMYQTKIGGEDVTFQRDDVLHIKGLGPNPYWGWDIVDLLVEAFGGAIAKEEHANRFFGQGATPAGFIEMSGSLGEEEEETFRESVMKAMHGLGNAHKLILLEENSKFHPITIDPEKSQLLEAKQFDVRSLAMVMGIKVHKLIDGANSAFASLEQANQEHKDDDVIPWVNKWRKEYNDKLLTEDQRLSGSHEIDVDDEALEWVPFSERASGTVELYNNGLIDKDEGRRKVNYGPSRTKRAKEFRIPANIVYEDDQALIATPTADPPPSNSPADDQESKLRQLTADTLSRLETRLRKRAVTQAAKGGKVFLGWLDDLAADSDWRDAPECIRPEVDDLYKRFCAAANNIVETATEGELKERVDAIKF